MSTRVRRAHGRLPSLALGLLAWMVGCVGGSGTGSSGLIGAEGILVARVIETQTCEEFEGVDYCPADAPDALPSGQFISTPFDDDSSVGCFQLEASDAVCVFVFSFEPSGFDQTQGFALAERLVGSDGPWDVFTISEPLEEGDEDFDLITVSIVIPLEDESGGELQLALLAFEEAVPDLPEESRTLAELGAETIFLVPPLAALPEVPDEESALETARTSTQCATTGVVAFCPSGVTFEPALPQAPLGPPMFDSPARLDVPIPTPLPCTRAPDDPRFCISVVDMETLGDVAFYLQPASRVRGVPGAPWTPGEEVETPFEIDLEEVLEFQAQMVVDLEGVDTTQPVEIDLVILVDTLDPFLEFESLSDLHETIPTYVFVTAPVLLDIED